MQLGTFSISLNVKDIKASYEFYTKLGFTDFGGDINQNWVILKNGNCTLGLFQGMITKNTLTFTPGWDENAQELENFTDVRQLQKEVKSQGLQPDTECDENSTGPAHFTLTDPDGNPILIDQYI